MPQNSRTTILVVDDERIVLGGIQCTLILEGFRPDEPRLQALDLSANADRVKVLTRGNTEVIFAANFEDASEIINGDKLKISTFFTDWNLDPDTWTENDGVALSCMALRKGCRNIIGISGTPGMDAGILRSLGNAEEKALYKSCVSAIPPHEHTDGRTFKDGEAISARVLEIVAENATPEDILPAGKILLVGIADERREVIAATLTKVGYEVVLADDYLSGTAVLREQSGMFDAIISFQRYPGLSPESFGGIDLIRFAHENAIQRPLFILEEGRQVEKLKGREPALFQNVECLGAKDIKYSFYRAGLLGRLVRLIPNPVTDSPRNQPEQAAPSGSGTR